jgi:hypothetical protein
MMTGSGANCHVRTLIEVVAPFRPENVAHCRRLLGGQATPGRPASHVPQRSRSSHATMSTAPPSRLSAMPYR